MIENIADAIPANVTISSSERSAILEIALLCIASDRRVDPDEEKAFRSIAKKIGEAKPDAILAKLATAPEREEADARLIELAKQLGTDDAKKLAYKVAYAMSLADMAASDEEFEFDLQLVDALGLEQGVVDDLAAEVLGSLGGGEE